MLNNTENIKIPKIEFYVTVMSDEYEKNLLGIKLFGELYNRWMQKRAYHKNLLSNKKWQNKFKKNGFKVKEELGYFNEGSTRSLDVLQYISAPGILLQKRLLVISKIYYRLSGWLIRPFIVHILKSDRFGKSFSAYFYVLKKK